MSGKTAESRDVPSQSAPSRQASPPPPGGGPGRLGAPAFVAVYLALCLTLFVITAILAWRGSADWLVTPARADMLRLLVCISCSGALGATVYSIRGLYKHCSLGDYDAKYVYWYLFRPWLGTVLGVVSYLLVCGGLLVLSGAGATTGGPPARKLLIALAFLAGFSANEFVMKLNACAKSLFGTSQIEGTKETTTVDAARSDTSPRSTGE